MKKILLISLFSLVGISSLLAQETEKEIADKNKAKTDSKVKEIVQATEFAIPTSGAFTLLGNNPANVTTPGFTKDIKLDYFLDEFSLKPNIAFEFQPVWLFGFKNVSLDQYRKAGPLVRFLSTANVSIGTFTKDDISKLAYSVKFSFFKDPMVDETYIKGINDILEKETSKRKKEEESKSARKFFLRKKISNLWTAVASVKKINQNAEQELQKLKAQPKKDDAQIDKLNILIANNQSDEQKYLTLIDADSLEFKKISASLLVADEGYAESLDKEVISFAKKYKEQNWAAPRLDIGAGKVDTYQNANLTQLGLKSNGFGIWANPSVGFPAGKNPAAKKQTNNGTATGSTANSADGIEREPAKILITGLFKYVESERVGQTFYGGNIRYGSSTLNLFAEYTYLKDGSDITNSLAYGGSYTIGSKKLIEFGIRTDYTKDFSFKSLIPVVAFNWKLGKDLFN